MDFGNIVALAENDPKPSTINKIVATDDNKFFSYDLTGKLVSLPKKGLNIIKMNDGTTKKVILK